MAVAFTRSETPGTEEATLFYGNERDADTLSIKEDGIRPTEDRSRALFAWETRSLLRRRVLQVVIGVLGLVIIAFIIVAVKLSASDNEYSYLGTARFNPEAKQIDFKNAVGQFVLSTDIGVKLSRTSNLEERHSMSKSRSKYVTSDGVSLILTQETDFIVSVNWTSSSKEPIVFMDCFKLSGAYWYGGSELMLQKWPLEQNQVNMGPYVPQSIDSSQNQSAQTFGPVLERYWLSSRGVAIVVDAAVPLHVSINAGRDGKLCIKSDINGYLHPAVSYLGYRVVSGYNPKDLHLTVISKFLGKPSGIPNEALITKPSWVIGNYSGDTSKNSVASLWDNISSFGCGYVVGSRYGENDGMPKWYQDAKGIGCKVSMNIHPYLRIFSKEFSEAASKGYLLEDCGGNVPGLIRWGNSLSACIDLTSNSSKAWFKKMLVSFGSDLFEFHGGDVTHLPSCYQFYDKTMDPGRFSYEYAKFAVSMNGSSIHVGHRTQALPIFVRMTGKEHTWAGLQTLIPTILTYSIMGYPYILPSNVGGHHGNVSSELYIRWMQVNAFLPGIQFEVDKAPWSFKEDTKTVTTTVKGLLDLRARLSPVILDAFRNVTNTGAPIIRPLWWVAPTDSTALTIDSQFMLGDTYLVAPVLEPNKSRINVYLPIGKWQEQFGERRNIDNRKVGIWKSYEVDLSTLPYFKCLALYN